MLASLFPRRTKRPCSRRQLLRSRPWIEPLEDRMLLSHTPLAQELVVNSSPVAGLFAPPPPPAVAVASDATGDFVVVWTSATEGTPSTYQVFARLYNRDGAPQGGEVLVSAPAVVAPSSGNGAVTVDVSMDAAGDFVVVYDAGAANGDRVIAHRYNANGGDLGSLVVNPFLNPVFRFSASPSVASDSAGDFVVAFTAGNATNDVYARQFNASGVAVGAPFRVNTDQTRRLTGPSIGSDGAGDFVVAWNTNGPNGLGIVARRFAASGKALDASPFLVSNTVQDTSTPDVSVARTAGTIVVTWDYNPLSNSLGFPSESVSVPSKQLSQAAVIPVLNGSPNGAFVLARRFDATGAPLSAEFVVNSDPLNTTFPPHVAVDTHGDFAVSWATGEGFSSVFFRAYMADGTDEGPQEKVNSVTGDLGPNAIATDDCGNLVVGWSGFDPMKETQILARIYRGSDICEPMMPPPPDIPPPPPVVPPPVVPPIVNTGPDPATVIALARATAPVARSGTVLPFLDLGFTTPPAAVVAPAARRLSSLDPFLTAGTVRTETLGEISGRVFEDLNGNGIQDPGEPSLRGQIVFLDLNDNGIPDEGEPIMKTDADGKYLFSGLALTRYKVRQDLRVFRMRQTLPENNHPYVIDLTPKNNSIADKDFGVRILPVTGGARNKPPALPTTSPTTPRPPSPEGGPKEGEPQEKAPDAPPP